MRKILLTLVALAAALALAGCATNHSTRISVPPDPTGGNNAGFSNASLQGTYIFTVHGFSRSSEFAIVGSITADGAGTISSGTRDWVSDTGTQHLDEAITGTYAVNQDGRGQLVIDGPSGEAIYRFVLTSPSSGKLFQDGTSPSGVLYDAVGSLQLQTGTPGAPSTASPYVIRLDGEDSSKSVYGAVGAVSYDAAGAITGTLDENDFGTVSPQLAASGAVSLTGTRGTQTLATPAGPNSATHNFVVYYVSPDRLELLSTDADFLLFGSEDLQDGAIATGGATVTGDQVFQLSGYDSTNYNVVETGRLTMDGSGGINSGMQDYSMNGTLETGVSFTGTYANSTPGGRWTAVLSPIAGPISNVNLVGWQIDSERSALLVTSASNAQVSGYQVVETGTMVAQTLGLTLANVQGNYAQFFSGTSNLVGDLESTGNCQVQPNGDLVGNIDIQTQYNGLYLDYGSYNGSYSVDSTTGLGSGSICGIGNAANFYTANADTIYYILTDSGLATEGSLVLQQP